MKKIFLLIIFIIIVIVISGFIYIASQKIVITRPTSPSTITRPDWFKTKEEVKEIIATAAPAPAINFTHDGNLIKQGAGTETEGWIFLYEEPGHPALPVNLIFQHFSLCDFGDGEKSCQIKLNKIESGIRVHLEGDKEGNEITVIKLKQLPEP